MVTLHENQRATSLLGLSRPQFDSAYLTKQDTRGPWSLHPSGLPSSKDKVEPPRQSNNSGKANWFWITDWQIDQSDPRVDPTSGWQYARSFENEMDEQWTPVAPTSGNGWVRRRRWVRVMNRQVDFARNLEHESETHGDYLSAAQDMVVGASYDGVETGQRLQAMKKLLRIYEESVQFLLAGIKGKER
ncbi:hypothetical protein BC941DRAFT_179110 [Chlamydoabsidia padenii]|nr:hypothetical protein BC941DRAFT_179110 [Chlamydoabsidia padenii]